VAPGRLNETHGNLMPEALERTRLSLTAHLVWLLTGLAGVDTALL
jgi:hypothetical protein